jgi:ribosomal protein L37E
MAFFDNEELMKQAKLCMVMSIFYPDFGMKLAIAKREAKHNYSQKSISSSTDSSAGLFVAEDEGHPKINEKCPRCGKQATEETIASCQEADCPYNYLRKIRGDAEPEGVREKEEGPDGEEENQDS